MRPSTSAVLVINAGSSTHKCKLFTASADLTLIWEGSLNWSSSGKVQLLASLPDNPIVLEESLEKPTKEAALTKLFSTLPLCHIQAIGHRIVHGGSLFHTPSLVTPAVKQAIASLIPLAPLHNPANLEGIELAEKLFPKVVQIAVFDTAFFTKIPESNALYPINWKWAEKGIRKMGFHGISHAFCQKMAANLLHKDPKELSMISCHLGNGASLATIQNGRCLDTSMGFTPMEGLMMGTRSGSIDPGILLYLMRQEHLTADLVDAELNNEAGLKGIAGDKDMRTVLKKMAAGEKRAQLAFEMYTGRLAFHIGGQLSHLTHLDALIFTAGIGENSPDVREAAVSKLAIFGLRLDSKLNRQQQLNSFIQAKDSSAKILLIHTEEERAIAEDCLSFLPL